MVVQELKRTAQKARVAAVRMSWQGLLGIAVLVAIGLEPDPNGNYRVKSSYLLTTEEVAKKRAAGHFIPVVQTDDSSAQHPHSVMTGLVPVIRSGTNSWKSFAYLSGTTSHRHGRDKPGQDGERWDRIGRRFGSLVLG
jgi:hypothetical protein